MSFKWYILQVVSGLENKVADSIREKVAKEGFSELIEEIIIPSEKVLEIRKGKKIEVDKKFFPGYVLLKMNLNDDLWHIIRRIPKVGTFLGASGFPQEIRQTEIDKILDRINNAGETKLSSLIFEVGEAVKVNDGPFESFVGTVEAVDEEKQRLRVSVAIFGRATPLDLDFTQVVKV